MNEKKVNNENTIQILVVFLTLVQAASHGNFDIVKTYLEYGADVNYRDQKVRSST